MLTTATLAAPRTSPVSLVIPGRLRRGAGIVGDLIALAAVVLCIPFVILAIGIPLALCVRLLLWMVGLR